jgi:hypothetical protein
LVFGAGLIKIRWDRLRSRICQDLVGLFFEHEKQNWQVKVFDHKSADHHTNLVFGAKNEDILKQNIQQSAAKFAALDFRF